MANIAVINAISKCLMHRMFQSAVLWNGLDNHSEVVFWLHFLLVHHVALSSFHSSLVERGKTADSTETITSLFVKNLSVFNGRKLLSALTVRWAYISMPISITCHLKMRMLLMGETEKKAFFLLQSFRLFPGLLQWGTGKSGEKLSGSN